DDVQQHQVAARPVGKGDAVHGCLETLFFAGSLQVLHQAFGRSTIIPRMPGNRTDRMARLLVFLAAILFAVSGASAQSVFFKGKTVTMIVGYPPGGGTDTAGPLTATRAGAQRPAEHHAAVQSRLATT